MEKSLREALAHVLWIGGGTDAGKSTVSRIVAERCGLQIYDYDRQDIPQTNRLAESMVYYRDLLDASDEEMWIHPEPEDLLYEAIQGFQDRFPLVVEELLAMPKEPMILAEGFGFTPEIIFPLLSDKHQAIWLVPSEEFKWASMKQRGKFIRRLEMSDPERAIYNLFTRDMLLSKRVVEQAEARNLRVEIVDGSRPVEEMVSLVEAHFKPYLQARKNCNLNTKRSQTD